MTLHPSLRPDLRRRTWLQVELRQAEVPVTALALPVGVLHSRRRRLLRWSWMPAAL